MKLKLTETELAALLPEIKQVLLTGKPWEHETLHHPVRAIVSAILTIRGMERAVLEDGDYGIEGFATNGWQWDWWQDFNYQGKRYTLSGSGYYGGHSFQLADE